VLLGKRVRQGRGEWIESAFFHQGDLLLASSQPILRNEESGRKQDRLRREIEFTLYREVTHGLEVEFGVGPFAQPSFFSSVETATYESGARSRTRTDKPLEGGRF
jgi:hypothetical protein